MKNFIFICCSFILIQHSFSQKGEISISSRFFHPTSKNDTLSTLNIIDKLSVTQIDWMYCSDSSKIKLLKDRNIKFSLAINPQVPDSGEYTIRGRIIGLNDVKYVAPWMKVWNQKNPNWGCVNSPFFNDLFIKKTKQLVDLGPYAILVDDSRFNEQSLESGGCFCEFCVNKFTRYLIDLGHNEINDIFNYKEYLNSQGIKVFKYKDNTILYRKEFCDFQRKSVIEFLNNWKETIKSYSGNIQLITNNYRGKWDSIYSIFDGGICEIVTDSLTDRYFQRIVKINNELKKSQSFTLVSNDIDLNLQFLLLCKKYSITAIAPWDVFIGTGKDNKPMRYYLDVDILATLYKNYSLFKGYKIIRNKDYSLLTLQFKKISNKKYIIRNKED
ncbi:hypothetical protein Emtol_4297 [Emticicia oligotrophica DSM 17448]|uniref:Glycoside hydrolase family 42 N-terminal domain-containing protein n=1 Tax=Emticicia oligotrophica (strain DSM 17448 / CIP 109782 / MTCC 6937 / GPTSA100-15) TaxID=929562 RepID=A0ABM5N7F1_EMTOG|nr:hypothetical protein [Emticicia oligotrophica]AFK05420.1 hypothetical protein Emtol_4297 [Emticicia oligotrophica DSM 17448]